MKLPESYLDVLKEAVSGDTKKPILTEGNTSAILKKVDTELLTIPKKKELLIKILNNPKIKTLRWNKLKDRVKALIERKKKLIALKNKLMKRIASETLKRR